MIKKVVKRLIVLMLSGMALVGLFVYLVDPFYHYHRPLWGMEPYLYNTVYQTPGVARNLEYDSVILGSSMTENFRTSWFDEELGWKTVKLSYSGATTNDLAAVMEQMFADNKDVKNVFMDINDYQLTGEPDAVFAERPEYLYDNNIINDVKYLLNKDVIFSACGRVLAAIKGVSGNMDSAYCWDEPELFGLQHVQKAYFSDKWQADAGRTYEDSSTRTKINVARSIANIENIQCFIEENPDTQFHVFYPPYSMIYWQRIKEEDRVEEMISVYAASIEKLLQYDNVSLYYFQDELEYISEMNNYRDLCHYSPEINRYIFECVKEGSHRITLDNYQEKLKSMYYLADSYDYEELWEEE